MLNLTITLLVSLFVYFFYGMCIYKIAVKLGYKDEAMFAFLPIFNLYLPMKMAEFPGVLMIFYFLSSFYLLELLPGIVGGVSVLASLVITVMIYMNISYARGFNQWTGVVIIAPVVNFVYLYFLAFSDKKSRIVGSY